MKLTHFECALPPTLADAISTLLEDEVLSVSWFESSGPDWLCSIMCKPSDEALIYNKILHFLTEHSIPSKKLTKKGLLPKDWVAAVYAECSPMTIGRFYIHGSHDNTPPPEGLIPLCIDAATAFGSGQHESTEGCLKALSNLSKDHIFMHPLDMDCGSGILAFAMAHLWGVVVHAYDNDVEAVRVTLENAGTNNLSSLIHGKVSEGFTSVHDANFDLITANILAGPLIHMAKDMAERLSPDGYVVLAGLLNTQAEDVIDAYRAQGLRLVDQLLIGEWSTLIMRKAAHG